MSTIQPLLPRPEGCRGRHGNASMNCLSLPNGVYHESGYEYGPDNPVILLNRSLEMRSAVLHDVWACDSRLLNRFGAEGVPEPTPQRETMRLQTSDFRFQFPGRTL